MSSPDSKDMDGLPGNIEGCPLDFSHVHTYVHSTHTLLQIYTPFYKYTHT